MTKFPANKNENYWMLKIYISSMQYISDVYEFTIY